MWRVILLTSTAFAVNRDFCKYLLDDLLKCWKIMFWHKTVMCFQMSKTRTVHRQAYSQASSTWRHMRTSGGETCIEKIGSSTSVGSYAKIGVVDN